MTAANDALDRRPEVAPPSTRRVASVLAHLLGLALVYGLAFGLLLTAAVVVLSAPGTEGESDHLRRVQTEAGGVVVAKPLAGGAE